jgi:thiosulfate dehydrogenase
MSTTSKELETVMNHIAIFVWALLLFATAATADDAFVGKQSLISLGGKLYDNHWLQSERMPPAKSYPGYPKEIDFSSSDTWRCVSCHGWDYSGADGHLGQQASSALFASLRDSAGKPAGEIAAILKSGMHKEITDVLEPVQIDALSVFISVGQHDIGQVLSDGKATGSRERGKDIFEGACVSCHQEDGKAYIQGEPGDKPALGWVAVNRPAQALHKIRNGVPGADMLSLRFLPEERVIDLLAYLQTLDTEVEQ